MKHKPGSSIVTLALLAALAGALATVAPAQDAPSSEVAATGNELSIDQARLADRYERLETVLARLAELSASTDPRRAKVLREAIAKSREQAIDQRFESIVSLLEGERLSAATGRQSELRKELDSLLSLLLRADRDRELDSQRKRIKAYLKEVGRLIRLEKGLEARTEGGDDAQRLAQDQKQVGEETGKLGEAIGDAEKKTDAKSGEAESNDRAQEDASKSDDASRDTQSKNDKSSKSGKPSESGKPSPSKPSESGSPGEGQPSPSQPSEAQQGQQGQQSQQGKSGESGESSGEGAPLEPTDRAAERLKQAQQAMQEAQKKLEESERKGAAASQREALKQLEQAKAELERVLRQLREEEMERTLALLVARFRKMLDAQIQVNEGTKRIARIPAADRDHDEEIESARLSREETQLVREADRALVLLHEEGSSMAFPETVSLMREDMQQVADRLAEVKVGTLTQGLEQDIVEALEELIAALDKAIKDLEKKKTPPSQMPSAGQPGDPPLVDKLAELKMIRALQLRINRRTLRYAQVMEDEPDEAANLVDELLELAERQQRVYQATHDLSQGRND